jgi:Tfp pilus tip-associated adhesin PilY1
MCDIDTYCHRFFVDGSPVVGDIYDDDDAKWRTLLVCGLREGGEAYFALDITYGKPFDDANFPSEYMWQFEDDELGQTFAEPSIDRVLDNAGGTAWGVFMSSGYKEALADQANKEAYVYGVEAHTMDPLWATGNRLKLDTLTLLNDVASPALIADLEGDFKGDFMYVGNQYGNMYRIEDIGKGQTPSISKLYDSGATLFQATPVSAKADFAYSEFEDEIWVYFGTGRYQFQVDKQNLEQQYFFGLKDTTSGTTTYTYGDLVELSADFFTISDASGATSFRVITGTNAGKDPWVVKLNNSMYYDETLEQFVEDVSGTVLLGSERVITQPLVVGGVVFFTTFTPDEDVCAGSGDAWLFGLDFDTGLPPDEPIFDINNDGVIDEDDMVDDGSGNKYNVIGLKVGAGQPSKPVLHKDTLFVTTTGGGLTPVKVNLPSMRAKLTTWRDY